MKTILLLLLLILPILATEQVPDILHKGKEKYWLQDYFPLESLDLDHPPFYGGELRMLSTACWRGYEAEWKIENDSLFLIRIYECHNHNGKMQDIITLFKKNDIEFTPSTQKIFANWVSEELYLVGDKTLITESFKMRYPNTKFNSFITIKNGIVTEKTEK